MKQKRIKKYFNKIHNIIFGNNAGDNTIAFTKNVSMSIAGGLSAFGILFIASIIAARVLGPEEYGKYAVVFSIAQMLSLFFVLELDISSLYFLSRKKNKQQEQRITASINMMFIINILIFTFLAYSLFVFFSPTDISQTAFAIAVSMALTFAFKRMIDAFLRSKKQFKQQAIFKIAESITVISVLGIFLFILYDRSYLSYANAIVLGGIVFIMLGGVLVRDKLNLRDATSTQMNKIFGYNIFGIIGAIVNSIVKNIDKLIVVAFLGVGTGGVYAVYFTASVIVGARLTQMFMSVFFPTLRADHKDITPVFKKINTLFVKTFLLTVILASLGVFIIILLYGSQYPVVWYWILLGGLYISIHFFASMYGWLLSSTSKDGYKKYNISFVWGLVAYGIVLLLSFYFDAFGITALLVGLIIYRIISGIISYTEIKNKYLQE